MYTFDPDWLAKLEALREAGVEPYPNGFVVSHLSTELHERFADVDEPGESEDGQGVAVAGRVMFRNVFGKAMFLRLQDRGEATVDGVDQEGNAVTRGGVIQVYLRKNELGDEAYAILKKIDIGDFVWVKGNCMRTRTGELTVHAQEAALAGKILSPFPDRYHEISDIELRARQRYVDLFMNASTRDTFRKRSRIVRAVRDFFEARDFLEVETPMMQVIPGGAAARPFVTHHNALNMPLYLRIAPELYLKRLVVGGFERVFEINRNFRNEGISIKHNPEFTMLEFYMAWATFHDLMDLSEELLSQLAVEITGSAEVEFDGKVIDYSPPFRRADMDELIAEKTGMPREDLMDVAKMEAFWRANQRVGEGTELPQSVGKWWEWYFDAYVEHELIHPTFVTGFPAEISPLARRNDEDPFRTDRFELIVNGWEIANAFSELNDPVDQAARFEAQVAAREGGDDESMYFDADYIRALTYGMPPTAGQGIGIDRLVMLLTGKTSIREVILFPTLRPERKAQTEAE
ncbi:MAG: lysine--tRNA ligase [Deltaproteobacteria bacterium]|nr:MAG: lysine--tRNA ligase [Deltaproteobacteria bacterium]